MNLNLKFHEIYLGQTAKLVEKFTLKDLDDFINFSGDNSAIHASNEESISKGFNNRVIHGAMIVAKASKLIGTTLPGDSALLLDLNFNFQKPLYPEQLFEIVSNVDEKHSSVNCISLKFIVTLKENHTKIAKGSALVRINE
jgi:3-hydroxybutyryl-CoA dehydratase